jgi:hypothetical protein
MMHTYDYIDGSVVVYAEGNDAPLISQPFWPDGTPWKTEAQAMAWGQAFANQLDNEEAPLAGHTPSKPTRARPTAEEIEADRREQPLMLNTNELEALIAAKISETMGT